MEVVANNYLPPGDQRLIDQLVYELKSQGIFDQFRKECFADVDTKPAYQNLRQRVEGSVSAFLKEQSWRPDMNKNQVREMLRKKIIESGYLETGVERIVDQVVNPKINTVFLPKVEEVVYNYLGLQKPSKSADSTNMNPTGTSANISNSTTVSSDIVKDEIKSEPLPSLNTSIDLLLPTDLEAVSPESEPAIDNMKKEGDKSSDTMQSLDDSTKMEEDESPPFEPLDEHSVFNPQEENSIDSHLSGFSGLVSHESNQSNNDLKNTSSSQMDFDTSNPQDHQQDSQMSQNSSDSRLSIVTSEDNTTSKLEVSCEESQPKSAVPPATADSDSLKPVDAVSMDKNEESKENVVLESGEPSLAEDPRKEENPKEEETTKRDEIKEDDEIKKEGEIKRDETKKDETKKDETKRGETKRDDPRKVEKKKETSKSKESTTKSSSSSTKHDKSRESKDTSGSKSDKKEDKARKSSTSDKDAKSSKHGREKDKDGKDKSKDRRSDSSSKGGASKDPKDKDGEDKSGIKEKDKDKDRSKGSSSGTSSSKHHHGASNKEKSSSSTKKNSSSSSSSKDKSDRDKDKNRTSSSSSKDTSKIKDSSTSSTTSSKSKEKSSSDKHSNKDKDRQSTTSSSSSHLGNTKKDNKDSSKVKDNKDSSSSSREKDSSKDKHSNNKDSSKDKDGRKRDQKKSSNNSSKDDHYSSKGKKFDRRSNDRDSNDEHSSSGSRNGSSSSSASALVQNGGTSGGGGGSGGGDSSQTQKSGKDKGGSGSGAPRNSSGGNGASGNSDQSGESNERQMALVVPELAVNSVQVNVVPQQQHHQKVKLLKPKCASNIQEAMRLMKIRRQLAKLEKQNQLSLTSVAVDTSTLLSASINLDDLKPRKNGFLINSFHNNNNSNLSAEERERLMKEQQMERDAAKDANLKMAKELVVVPSPLQNTVISQDNWDAMEAKLRQEVCSEFSSSYGDEDEDVEEYYVAEQKPEEKIMENGDVELGEIETSSKKKTEDNSSQSRDSEKKKNVTEKCDKKKTEDRTVGKKKSTDKADLSDKKDNNIGNAVGKTKDDNVTEDKVIENDDKKKIIRTRRNGKQKSIDDKIEEVHEISETNEHNKQVEDTSADDKEMKTEENQDNRRIKTRRTTNDRIADKKVEVKQKIDKKKNERKLIIEEQQSEDRNNTDDSKSDEVVNNSGDKELSKHDETQDKKDRKMLRKRKMTTKVETEVVETNKEPNEQEVVKNEQTEANQIEGKSEDNKSNETDKNEGISAEVEHHEKDKLMIKKRKLSQEKTKRQTVDNNNGDYKIGRETLIVERLEDQNIGTNKTAQDEIEVPEIGNEEIVGDSKTNDHEEVEDINKYEAGCETSDKNAEIKEAEDDIAQVLQCDDAEVDNVAKKRKILDIVGVLDGTIEDNNAKRRKTENGNAKKKNGRNKKVVYDIEHVEKLERMKSDEDMTKSSSDEENSSCKYFDQVDIDSIEFLLFTAKYIKKSETDILQRKKCQRKTRKRKMPTELMTAAVKTKTDKEILKDNNKINNNHLANKNNNNVIKKLAVTPEKKRRGNGRHKTENTCLIGTPLQNLAQNEKSPDKMDVAAENLSSIKTPRRKVNQQRYSSDDLYKPRLSFVSSRRRGAKTVDDNN